MKLFKEIFSPGSKSPDIMRTNVFQMEQTHIRGTRQGIAHSRDGRNTTPRKDVPLDEIHFLSGNLVTLVRNSDGLQQHHSIWLDDLKKSEEPASGAATPAE